MAPRAKYKSYASREGFGVLPPIVAKPCFVRQREIAKGNRDDRTGPSATFLGDMAITVRPITEDELDRFITSVRVGVGGERGAGEDDRIREVIGLDRTFAAFDGERIVGTMGSYGLTLSVPGPADVAAAGLTRVTVASTHRRRGILNAMMDVHFEDAVANEEPVATLWASELAIYGRYGYGVASATVGIEMDSRLANIAPPQDPDSLLFYEADKAAPILAELHERIRRQRPGHFARSTPWWAYRTLADHPFMRGGASPQRHVIASRDGEPVGYVLYRQKSKWDEHQLPIGTTDVVELMGIDDQAEHTLWSYVASIDLFPNVSMWTQPIDSILPYLAGNQRAVVRKTNDGLMVRILDVCQALSARRYDAPGALVLQVTPAAIGSHSIAGTYRLDVGLDGSATCEPSTANADIMLSTQALGALYLGHVDRGVLGAMKQQDILSADRDATDQLQRCFGWPVAPWCSEEF